VVVVRGVDPLLDQEAKRVLKAVGGRWRPAVNKKEIVKQRLQIPISFRFKE